MKSKTLLLFLLLPAWLVAQEPISIGINFVSPPFHFVHWNEATGRPDTIGVDREIAETIARKLKCGRVVYKPVFGAGYRKQDLDSGKVDLIIAAFSITEERQNQKIIFSNPYYRRPHSLALLSRPESGITKESDLKGKRYGFVIGSTSQTYVSENLKPKLLHDEDTIGIAVGVEDQIVLMEMLISGAVDAVIDDYNLLNFWQKNLERYHFRELRNSREDKYGIGIGRKYNTPFYIAQINSVVDSIFADHRGMKARIDHYNALQPSFAFMPPRKKIIAISILAFLPFSILIGLIVTGIIEDRKTKRAEKTEREARQARINQRKNDLSGEPINCCLIFANARYQSGDDLGNHPYDDAIEVKRALMNYGFHEEDIAIFKDATRKGIIKTFQDLVTGKDNSFVEFSTYARPIDNLLIYYSGHGHMISHPGSATGFWKPIDGNESWGFIPDYEIMHYVGSMRFNQVLLVSDSCFSGTLIQSNKHPFSGGGTCIDVITAGNSRVPALSKFRQAFTNSLQANKSAKITSKDIYHSIAGQLTNDTYYQPQFGSLRSNNNNGQYFEFNKSISTTGAKASEDDILRVLSAFGDERVMNRNDLLDKCSLNEANFNEAIREMIVRNLISLYGNKVIRIVKSR